MGEDGRMAGGDGDAVAFVRFVPRDEFEELAGDAEALEFGQGDEAGDAFGFLPAEGGDGGAEGDGLFRAGQRPAPR